MRYRISRKWLLCGVCVVIMSLLWWLNCRFELIAFHLSNDDGKSDLKVLTFNIHAYGEHFDSAKIDSLIESEDADIVLLNEYVDSTAHALDSLLLCTYQYTGGERKGLCQDILYSKMPILDYKAVKGGGLLAPPHRCVIKYKDTDVRLFLCHLTSNNSEVRFEDANDDNSRSSWKQYWDSYKKAQSQRAKEVDLICSHLDTIPRIPTLILGDFNDFSCAHVFEPIYDRGFKDAWWNKGFGYGATWKYDTFRLRIDHVFYFEDLEPTKCRVIESNNLSDHNALVVEFKLK